jgi:hypothetical protein
MAKNTDWMPTTREGQLAMAKTWAKVLKEKGSRWGVTPADISELDDLIEDADKWLARAKSSDRTAVITANCQEAFAALVAFMRNLKARKFFSPPMTNGDIVEMELKPKDTTKTPVPQPTGQATGSVTYPGPHLMMVHIQLLEGTIVDPRADYGYRIYWGILPQGGASLEQAAGPRRYLTKPPVLGQDLPNSRFTKRKKELFDFPADDSGKTVYFCVRLENSKGNAGPWGPVFSAIIP